MESEIIHPKATQTDNIFDLENPELCRCRVWNYTPSHSQLEVQIGSPSVRGVIFTFPFLTFATLTALCSGTTPILRLEA
jgi:hypothetical protein